MDFAIYYIQHLIEPYLIYCLTKSYFLGVFIPVLWELVEYGMYMILGNYSILFLETEDSVVEPLYDILMYDIGGGILATYIAFTLYHMFDINTIIIKDWSSWSSWRMILLFALKLLVSSPFSAIGWECDSIRRSLLGALCPEDGEYQLFAWGLLGLIAINVAYIFYMFEGTQRYVTLSYPVIVFLTGMQRAVYNVVLAMWISFGISVIFTGYWLYVWCGKKDYNVLPTVP